MKFLLGATTKLTSGNPARLCKYTHRTVDWSDAATEQAV
jgi:hypothetical protein